MKQNFFLTLCFFLLALKASAQQLTATIDSVIASPMYFRNFYAKMTIKNNSKDTLFLNKGKLMEGIVWCTEEREKYNEYLYVQDWEKMIDSNDYRLIYHGVDLDSKIQRKGLKREIRLQKSNDKIHSVILGGNTYIVLQPYSDLQIMLNRSMMTNEIIHINSHLSDEQKRKLKMSVNLVLFCYREGEDKQINLFVDDAEKIKQYLIR